MEIIVPILKSALIIMIPVLFAAAGGLFPALSGNLNIALEGLLLAGAFSSLVVFYYTGSIFLSVAAAVCAATALSALHSFTVFKLRANNFIAGLAINLLSSGLTIILCEKLFNTKGVVIVKDAGANVNWYLAFAFLFLAIIWIGIYKTPFGYRLRACEKDGEALRSLGIDPKFYQSSALLISGFFCGIGGSFLSLNLGAFVPGMSAGKGWIALVVIFIGRRNPLGLLAAALVFGIAEAFSNHAQGLWKLPSDFILAFPYLCTFVAIMVVSVKFPQIFPGQVQKESKK
jgi:simple sugar transport system permease protein